MLSHQSHNFILLISKCKNQCKRTETGIKNLQVVVHYVMQHVMEKGGGTGINKFKLYA